MTEFTDFQLKFANLLPHIIRRFDERLSQHTSFRIGGPAQIMVFPKNAKELSEILKVCTQLCVKPLILGAGTNVLAPDHGIDGVVVCLKDCMDGMDQVDENKILVSAGVTMTRLAVFAANCGLSGLEFAHGVPGTVGGGIYMNAGAYGGEICQVCHRVEIMDFDGNIHTYTADQMDFAYRHSILEDVEGIVIRALFVLKPGNCAEIRDKMKELMSKRSASQPLDLPSAGSAFKRPVGGYAAALIDQCGLRGYQIGGAAISQKHTGFVVNVGNATANDVKELLQTVSNVVYEKTGIRLEPEVRIW